MTRPIDRRTVDQLVVEHLPFALRMAQRLCGDAELAEELVQEALCRVLRNWRTFRGEASFRTWLAQIVVNVHRDRTRRRREYDKMPPEGAASSVAEPSQHVAALELSDRIRAEVAQLPPRQREVVLLCLGEGMDAREAAAALDTTAANVHTCLHLARRQIGQAIGFDPVGKEKR